MLINRRPGARVNNQSAKKRGIVMESRKWWSKGIGRYGSWRNFMDLQGMCVSFFFQSDRYLSFIPSDTLNFFNVTAKCVSLSRPWTIASRFLYLSFSPFKLYFHESQRICHASYNNHQDAHSCVECMGEKVFQIRHMGVDHDDSVLNQKQQQQKRQWQTLSFNQHVLHQKGGKG